MNGEVIRIRYLDSLRGIAALCVVIFHFIGGFGPLPGIPHWFLRTPLAFFTDGIAAVALFFVLSGFVLTIKNFLAPQHYSIKNSLDTFIIHRIMRIMPPFIAWVIISALCQRYLYPFAQNLPDQNPWLQEIWKETASWHRVLREFFIIAPVTSTHLIPQDWSLTYELNISLFVPLYTLLGLAGNLPFYFYLLLRSTKSVFLFQFFLGMSLAKHFNQIQSRVSRLGRINCFLFFLLGLSLYSARIILSADFPTRFHDVQESITWILNGFGAAIIIAVAIGSEQFQKILNHSFLIWLGKISYSLYLLHLVVLKCLTPILLQQIKSVVTMSLALWVSLIISVLVSLGLSQISYSLFESPSIKLGKILTEKWKHFLARQFGIFRSPVREVTS